MNQGIGRTNTHIQPSCNPFNCYSSVFMNQFQVLSSFLVVVAVAGRPELSVSVTLVRPFSNISVHSDDSTRENFIPILSTHAEMNLCSRHTFCPQKAYDQTLFLFGAICKFRSHLRHSVTTLILHCKVSRLARLTSHMTRPITTTPALTVFCENIKVRKLFENPSYLHHLQAVCSHIH